MNTTDNTLRAEIILLATKALDLLNHALDLLSADVVGRSALPLGSSKNASERCSSGSVVGNASERYNADTDLVTLGSVTHYLAPAPISPQTVTLGSVTHYPIPTVPTPSASTNSTSGRTTTCATTPC